MKAGWDLIRERNERMERAAANRKPAWSADESTGSVRFQPIFFEPVAYPPLSEWLEAEFK